MIARYRKLVEKKFLVKLSPRHPVHGSRSREPWRCRTKYGGLVGSCARPWLKRRKFVALWKVRRKVSDRDESGQEERQVVCSDTAQESSGQRPTAAPWMMLSARG